MVIFVLNLDTFICICDVALSNMFGYATELRGITQGIVNYINRQGEFSMEYKNHKPVPQFDVEKIIQKFQQAQAAKASSVKKGGSSFDI